jgi:hypothetical protein
MLDEKGIPEGCRVLILRAPPTAPHQRDGPCRC